jgi:hypothetical protein
MGAALPPEAAVTLDELTRAAREAVAIRRAQHGPPDSDDPLDEALARLLRHVEQLEAEVA